MTTPPAPTPSTPIISNQVYNVLKWLVTIAFPAAGALYFGLSQIWGLPAGSEVVGTLALISTFGGVVMGISAKQYNASDARFDGALIATQGDDGTVQHSLSFNTQDLTDLHGKGEISLKVDTTALPASPVS
jgi:hypothetical protein